MFDEQVLDRLQSKQEELKKILPSISLSRTVNYCLKEYQKENT